MIVHNHKPRNLQTCTSRFDKKKAFINVNVLCIGAFEGHDFCSYIFLVLMKTKTLLSASKFLLCAFYCPIHSCIVHFVMQNT